MILSRRGFLGTVASLLAAPAIVRAASLMPVRNYTHLPREWWIDDTRIDAGFADGSFALPFSSLAAAMKIGRPGDTFYCNIRNCFIKALPSKRNTISISDPVTAAATQAWAIW
jgi:hypothetical protein